MEMTQDRGYSEEVAGIIDEEVRRIIDTAQARATQILENNKEKLEELSRYLLEFEKIDGEVFQRLMDGSSTLEELVAETEKENAVKAEKAKKAREAQEAAQRAREAEQPPAGHRPHFTPPFVGRPQQPPRSPYTPPEQPPREDGGQDSQDPTQQPPQQ